MSVSRNVMAADAILHLNRTLACSHLDEIIVVNLLIWSSGGLELYLEAMAIRP